MLRAYKTKVVTNNQESGYFLGCAGFGRFVYNWGLAAWKEEYEAGGKPSAYGLSVRFNAIKDEQFPWAREYPYVIGEAAFGNLGLAFQNFFRRVKTGETPGYPRFKSKHKTTPAFSLRGSITVESGRVVNSHCEAGSWQSKSDIRPTAGTSVPPPYHVNT